MMYSNKNFLSTYFRATLILFILTGILVVIDENKNTHVSDRVMFMGYVLIFIVLIGFLGFLYNLWYREVHLPKRKEKALNKLKKFEKLGFSREENEYRGIYKDYQIIIDYFDRIEYPNYSIDPIRVEYFLIKVLIQQNEVCDEEIGKLMAIFGFQFYSHKNYIFLLDEMRVSTSLASIIDQLNTIVYQLKTRNILPYFDKK